MKTRILAILFILFSFSGSGQAVFNIPDTIITINNPVDASPAHWYTEIYNLVNLDTGLRWKAVIPADFPQQWEITFDDQNQFYNPVSNGDSADFTLYQNPTFPQKLIIGNILNKRTGVDTMMIHVYEPGRYNQGQTIYWVFRISARVGLEEEDFSKIPNLVSDGIDLSHIPSFDKIRIYSLTGEIQKVHSNTGYVSFSDLPLGFYILEVWRNGNIVYRQKILRV